MPVDKRPTNEYSLADFAEPKRIARMEDVLNKRTDSLRILLENVTNEHNISAVIRSADAFGIQNIYLVGTPLTPCSGITMGCENWLTYHSFATVAEAVNTLRNEGFKLAVLQPEGYKAPGSNLSSMPIFDLPFRDKLVLAFGNERNGISPELAAQADWHAFIPMVGFVDSLNISVAAAISMFCSMFSQAINQRQVSPLDPEAKAELFEQWLKVGIRNSNLITKELKKRKE